MTVPETYLKTQQVADALGVSASTVKRWVDRGSIDATRTHGKHRLVTLSSALKFAQREKMPIASLLAIQGADSAEAIEETVVATLTDLLKAGQAREATALIGSVYQSTKEAAILADHLIRPVMERIGHGWMVGSWDIYQEHQASQIVGAAIQSLSLSLAEKAGDELRPLALGASPEGDPYTLPGLLGELVLRDAGWEVKNLGGSLPMRSLALATRHYRPRLVFLTASHIADRDGFVRDYAYFYEAASQVGSAIMLGGRGLGLDLRSSLVCAGFGERMAHLAEFARRLLPTIGPSPDTPSKT